MTHPLSDVTEESVLKQIELLERQDLERSSLDDLESNVRSLLNGHTALTRLVSMPVVYRALKYMTEFTHIRQLWYPPPECVKRLGRANRVGESIMYCADSKSVAILEIRPTVGEVVTVLQCVARHAPPLLHMFELAIPERSPHMIKGTAAGDVGMIENVLESEENMRKNALVRRFLVNQYTRRVDEGSESSYKLSAAIAGIFRDHEIDGIWYPSIATNAQGTNAAIRPHSADRYFKPVKCWQLVVEKELDDAQFEVRCIKTTVSIANDGFIVWDK